jgi:hypothetical protein
VRVEHPLHLTLVTDVAAVFAVPFFITLPWDCVQLGGGRISGNPGVEVKGDKELVAEDIKHFELVHGCAPLEGLDAVVRVNGEEVVGKGFLGHDLNLGAVQDEADGDDAGVVAQFVGHGNP